MIHIYPIFVVLIMVGASQSFGTETVDYSLHVQPLFAEKCLKCHGPDKQKGSLRLDERASTLKALEGDELFLRITSQYPDIRMPPKGTALSSAEVEMIKTWASGGAPFAQHWAFQPIKSVQPVHLGNQKWGRSPIDHFVLSRLENENIKPSPEADRFTLIKRLYYDLIGLPPTPEAVNRFVSDARPDAYERLVDDLLASPHFGERWGRHWLDKARYADSDGYEKDNPRPTAWHYRDWVIKSIAADMPMDQFTTLQLAGDLLPNAGNQEKLATAFHRQTLTNTEGGADKEEFRTEAVFDRTETTAMLWLGLTMNCARCHNHKYDPIRQVEYYQLFDFFNNGDEATFKQPHSESAMAEYAEKVKLHQTLIEKLGRDFEAAKVGHEEAFAKWAQEVGAKDDGKVNLPEAITKILKKTGASRSPQDQEILRKHFLHSEFPPTKSVFAKIEKERKQVPREPVDQIPWITQASKPRETHVLERGVFLTPGEKVSAGGLEVLPPITGREKGKLDRLDLATWLMAEANPLPARVLANHVWEKLFGEGLVRTVNDFGVRGDKPVYPELLDWLGGEYRRLKWSRKALIKTIVNSATYRQSSAHRMDLIEIDPNNYLLARQNRFRVEGEILRDLCLSVSGLLTKKMGGPSVFPPMPPEVAALSYANNFTWRNSVGPDRYRRGMYTFLKRTSPDPNLMTFDCPDSNTSTVKRQISNTPTQALTLLNNEVFAESAQAFAKRILAMEAGGDQERIAWGLQLCLARVPGEGEVKKFLSLLDESRKWYLANQEDAVKLAGQQDSVELASWIAVARIILNLDEFITRE